MVATISRDELKEKLDRGDKIIIADVLPPDVYQKSHLPSAISLPANRLDELAPQLIPDKGADIVVYCMNTM